MYEFYIHGLRFSRGPRPVHVAPFRSAIPCLILVSFFEIFNNCNTLFSLPSASPFHLSFYNIHKQGKSVIKCPKS